MPHEDTADMGSSMGKVGVRQIKSRYDLCKAFARDLFLLPQGPWKKMVENRTEQLCGWWLCHVMIQQRPVMKRVDAEVKRLGLKTKTLLVDNVSNCFTQTQNLQTRQPENKMMPLKIYKQQNIHLLQNYLQRRKRPLQKDLKHRRMVCLSEECL